MLEHFPEPTLFAPYEILAMRFFLALVLYRYVLSPKIQGTRQDRPVGIAHLVDLSFIATYPVNRGIKISANIALVFYSIGFGLHLITPYLFLVCLVLGTFKNSQGATNHQQQVLAAILLVQSAFYLLAGEQPWFSLEFHNWQLTNTLEQEHLALFWSQQAVIAVYLTAGITKMAKSGIYWLSNAPKIALQLIKSSEQKFYNSLEPSHRDKIQALADRILSNPGLTRLALGLGLLLELSSPLFLYNRLSAILGGTALVLFHRGLKRYMLVVFRELEWTVIILFINIPYLLVELFNHLLLVFGRAG